MYKDDASFGFLQKLDQNEQRSLEAIATCLSFKRKEYIFQANLTSNAIYVLVEGRVKLSRLSALGQECIQWFCCPGEIFGLSQNVYDYDSGLYAQALAPSKVWAISRYEFNQLLLEKPRLGLIIIEQLSSRVRSLGNLLLHITCDNAHSRLVNLLHRFAQLYGSRAGNEIYIDMQLTHQEIADMIGVCRQTVSTMMANLKRSGIVSADRRGISIKCPASLDKLLNSKTSPVLVG
ncbi:MAG: Crp/Fnr family transcriptional regulator [Gammaproteobacteria bacterium]|nr:Crp/Fnr family transcriptional regulator [Gammaproteobacteria bacterium]